MPAVLLLVAIAAPLDLFKSPPEIKNEKGSIAVTDTNGRPRWTADWTMAPVVDNGARAVRFTETGRGAYSGFPNEVQWSLEAIWSADGFYRPRRVEKTYRDTSGKVLAVEKKVFGATTMRYERVSGGRTDSKSIAIPRDVIAVDGIAAILRSFPFDTGRFSTNLMSNEPRLYDVTIESRGRERIRTPAGEFDCYKLEFVPHLGVLNVLRSFVGKTVFWMTVQPPHFWVRYQGYENGRGTPQIIMELKSYEH